MTIKFSPRAGFNPFLVVARVMQDAGITPESISMADVDGRVLVLGPPKYCDIQRLYDKWARNMHLSWMNRPSLVGDSFRWCPGEVFVLGVPDSLQAAIDSEIDKHVKKSCAKMGAAYIEHMLRIERAEAALQDVMIPAPDNVVWASETDGGES